MCSACDFRFPILRGIAVLCTDWYELLARNAGFLAKHVPAASAPKSLRVSFPFAPKLVEDSLCMSNRESDLFPYIINHAIFADPDGKRRFDHLLSSPMLLSLVQDSRRCGPYAYVHAKARQLGGSAYADIGCGVGTALALGL